MKKEIAKEREDMESKVTCHARWNARDNGTDKSRGYHSFLGEL